MTEHSSHSHHPAHTHSGKDTGQEEVRTGETIIRQLPWTNIILLLSLGILLFGMGYKFGEWRIAGGNISASAVDLITGSTNQQNRKGVDFGLFWDVWGKLEKKYVDKTKLDAEKMYYGAIKGMVASLGDPYTFFLTPEENKKSKDDLGGRFEGIGAELGLKAGAIVVVAPIKNSPSIKAGLRAGDIITKVNDESIKGWSLSEAVSKIRGPGGTTVKITVVRPSDGKEYTFAIVRDTIKVDSIELTYERKNKKQVAIVKINQFGETTNSEWDRAASEILQRSESGQVDAVVVDLRDNPGGYLESAVYIASEFLEQGKMVVKQESSIEEDREYSVRRTGRLLEIPLVVVLNGGSASASEILAGALRDHNRARIVGEKSFGKGSVQEALDLAKGSGLHVTVAKWVLPGGEWINGKGITPEILVTNQLEDGNTLTRETDAQLDRAVELASE
ncbi:MAG: S41 family peptidase [Patescibacteria group bacterium]|nr:S41 family peptidase [Patescibacteria group bacterium]